MRCDRIQAILSSLYGSFLAGPAKDELARTCQREGEVNAQALLAKRRNVGEQRRSPTFRERVQVGTHFREEQRHAQQCCLGGRSPSAGKVSRKVRANCTVLYTSAKFVTRPSETRTAPPLCIPRSASMVSQLMLPSPCKRFGSVSLDSS